MVKDIYVTVPMIDDMELAVSKTAETLAVMSRFSPDQVDEIRHAVIEACINAIEHSHSLDRKIYLQFRLFSDRLEIRVRDRGKGFDIRRVETPDLKKKLRTGSRKRGWGLMLISNLMDDVRIEQEDPGTSVIMVKQVTPERIREGAHG
ncbi:ATP-binding protein [bacterium]|nr:ATP-binding protein [candidate division CSSED10-310 bacterium]